jgi:hypothetical protein
MPSASDERSRAEALVQALQTGQVILILGREAGDQLETLAVAFIAGFNLRLALLIGTHPHVEEALRQSGRPVSIVPPAALEELLGRGPDPNTFYLITLDADKAFEDLRVISSPPVSEPFLAVLREYSGLVLGMEPDDPWLEALAAALWPEGRFPRPWFILTFRPRADAVTKGIRVEDEETGFDRFDRTVRKMSRPDLPPPSDLGELAPPRPPVAAEKPEESRWQLQTLRMDAAAPAEVVVGDPFVLAVSVRRPESPPLREEDLNLFKSGEAQVVFPETGPIKLRLRVSAPECTFDGPNEVAFRLFPETDSPVFYFHLIPRSTGLISIVVQLFQEDEWLGGLRLQTRADSAPAGTVTMTVTSRPLTTPAPELKDQVQTLENRLQKARRFLAHLEEEAVVMPPGAERAALQVQIEETKAEIVAIERELDRLLAPVG